MGHAYSVAHPCLEADLSSATIMPRAEDNKLKLTDASGGLNNRDLPGSLAVNQFSELDGLYTDEGGYPGKQIPGADVIQFAPIAPKVFVSDANTLGLWHLDETASPYIDSSSNSRDMTGVNGDPASEASLFLNGQRLSPASPASGTWTEFGSLLRNSTANILDGLSAVCLEAWCLFDPSFSGQEFSAMFQGTNRTLSDSGAVVLGTLGDGGPGRPGVFVQGITAHRDWDVQYGKNSSDPYFKFTLNTNGVPGTQTVLQSFGQPTGKWLHVRAEYDSSTGLASLYVNGSLQAQVAVVGGGPTLDASAYAAIGGGAAFFGSGGNLYRTFNGVIDEARISSITRTATEGFPFEKPRPRMQPFQKSDGTAQLITPAGDGLYYTVGDGNWTLIKSGLSEIAKWDFVQMGDIIYGCNGVDGPLAWDGRRWVPWGNGVTPLVLSPLGAGTGPAAGTYKYLYTYIYGAEETGPSPIAVITTGSTGHIIVDQIPTRHDNCSSIKVYRTKDGGSTFYLLREIDNNPNVDYLSMSGGFADNSSPFLDAGADGQTDAKLGTGLYVQMTAEALFSGIGKPIILVENFDRIFMNDSDDRYKVRWSEPGLPDISFAVSFVKAQGNLKVTALSKTLGEIQAHKDGRGCLVLRGDSPSNWRQFDNLHPTLGAVDHFGIVYRTTAKQGGGNTDTVEVCIPTPQGYYGYQGYNFYRIDEAINGTFGTLAQANSTKLEWLTTSQAQFSSAASFGGSATKNIQANGYETDGLRQVPGELGIVDQLDYIGLWSAANPLVSGELIAVAKADGEGCFYFSTNADNKLYYTSDNFLTKTIIPGTLVESQERIIQIVRRGTDDFWFLVTDSAGTDYTIGSTTVCRSSGGGHIYNVNDPLGLTIGPVWLAGGDLLFYDLDVPFRMNGNRISYLSSLIIGNVVSSSLGVPVVPPPGSNKNIFLNHNQTSKFQFSNSSLNSIRGRVMSTSSVSSSNVLATISSALYGIGTNQVDEALLSGFYMADSESNVFAGGTPAWLYADYTRREFPRWRGGTFSPQAVWDATNSRLLLLASSAEDANGNRTTEFRTLQSNLGLATWSVGKNVSAFTPLGAALYFWTVETDATTGCVGKVNQSTLASPNTGIVTAAAQANMLALRLSYNPANTDQSYVGSFKYFGTGTQEYWTYQGSLRKIPVATSIPVVLADLIASGDGGPVPVELAVQTNDPGKTFATVQNISVAALYAMDPDPSGVTVAKQAPYQGRDASTASAGTLSNLLFVPSSDFDGGYLWSDRLYWDAAASVVADSRFVQFGVPGNWQVQGSFVSELKNLGEISSLGDFDTSYNGSIAYSFANGTAGPFAAADFKPVTPNQRLTIANAAPGPISQWRADLTQIYALDAPSSYPTLEFVNVSYYSGNASIPTIAAVHHKGRTRWSVARTGQEANDLEIVYQKNNTWTTASDRRIISYAVFRGDLVCFEDYTLLRMEKGATWAGRPNKWRCVTGYLMGAERDKYIRFFTANVMEYPNSSFPNNQGWFKVTPLAAGVEIPGCAWFAPIPATASTPHPRQTNGVMKTWGFGWARALALEIKRSDDGGSYIPDIQQVADIQELFLTLRTTPERRIIPVT